MQTIDDRRFSDSGRTEQRNRRAVLRRLGEEIMRVLSEYYEAVGANIIRHGATLTHFSGDGLMVLLNAPVASRIGMFG